MSFRPLVLLAFALPLSAIAAPQPNWYVSADAGSASISCLPTGTTKCDTSNALASFAVGSEVMPSVSVEGRVLSVSSLFDAAWADGRTTKGDVLLFAATTAKSFAVNDKLSFPIRAGIFNSSSKFKYQNGTENSFTKTSWTVGFGAEYNFDKSWFAKADYNLYNDGFGDDNTRSNVTTLSLGVGMRF